MKTTRRYWRRQNDPETAAEKRKEKSTLRLTHACMTNLHFTFICLSFVSNVLTDLAYLS